MVFALIGNAVWRAVMDPMFQVLLSALSALLLLLVIGSLCQACRNMFLFFQACWRGLFDTFGEAIVGPHNMPQNLGTGYEMDDAFDDPMERMRYDYMNGDFHPQPPLDSLPPRWTPPQETNLDNTSPSVRTRRRIVRPPELDVGDMDVHRDDNYWRGHRRKNAVVYPRKGSDSYGRMKGSPLPTLPEDDVEASRSG
ncbi:hypothetical protein AK830_g449 [Neonectria ditissima]|uniref:Uncharacterized protein n=1 Tax=Neonectria ditissima TaxID=78410 RepID=A0A0P7BX51_9HYPO|nr:hypothetical protein AK830_g449 [Neonectria ditissima]